MRRVVSFGAVLVAVAAGAGAAERDVTVPAAFDAWFARACAPDPSERFGSATG